ncbi:MAG: glycosyltransferase [Planctomycetia bacterium]|nr:glycosyltransferase [Planctomycetia bacterium]
MARAPVPRIASGRPARGCRRSRRPAGSTPGSRSRRPRGGCGRRETTRREDGSSSRTAPDPGPRGRRDTGAIPRWRPAMPGRPPCRRRRAADRQRDRGRRLCLPCSRVWRWAGAWSTSRGNGRAAPGCGARWRHVPWCRYDRAWRSRVHRRPTVVPPSENPDVRLTAIIAARNESATIGRCCEHLSSQGIAFVLIDDGSTDDTRAIAESFRGRGLLRIVDHPHPGHYDWTGLLRMKERIAVEVDSDWFMHLDADEIPEPPERGGDLLGRIAAAAAAGYTAVNFDEFVFLPSSETERHEGTDYVAGMPRYYFFEPSPQRLVRAWRATPDIDLVSAAGHSADLPGRRVCPESFVLRHYIGLSMEYLRRKYVGRAYARAELARGWHRARARLTAETIRTPVGEDLFDIRTDGGWNRSRPRARHLFMAEEAAAGDA